MSEWNGGGLPPVGFECEFKKRFQDEKHFSRCYIVGTKPAANHPDDIWLVFSDAYDNLHQHNIEHGVYEFRKLETEAERENRERLEAAYDLYCSHGNANVVDATLLSFCRFKELSISAKWLVIVDKTNYRKERQ